MIPSIILLLVLVLVVFPLWALTLPLAGILYGAMTVDSAVRHVRDARAVW